MNSAAVSPSPICIYLPKWIPQPLQGISFPDFTYIRRAFGIEPWTEIYKAWDQDSDLFIKELLSGKVPPVRIEAYLQHKDDKQILELLEKIFQKATCIKEPFSFEQILNGCRLIRLDEKIQEYTAQLLIFKNGYLPQEEIAAKGGKQVCRTKVLYNFFPNLVDTFLKAFNMTETGKRPETIWDYQAMIAIYMSALSLPAALFGFALHVTAAPMYALIITGVLTAAFVGGLYVYLRWLRPLPHDLPNCENVLDISTSFFADYSRNKIKQTIITALEAGQNVLLYGESGCGKSALAKEVARGLKAKSMQRVKDSVFGSSFTSPIQKLENDFLEARKNPGKVVFLIEDIDRIMDGDNRAAENVVKTLQELMADGDSQIFGICEIANYEQKIKPRKELDGRFTCKIHLRPPEEIELAMILTLHYLAEGRNVDFREPLPEIIDHIIARTNANRETMRTRAQPAAALDVWKPALKKMEKNDFSHYESGATEKLLSDERDIQSKFGTMNSEEKIIAGANLERISKERIISEKTDEQMRKRIQRVRLLSSYRIAIRKSVEADVRAFKQGDEEILKRWMFLNKFETFIETNFIEAYSQLPQGVKVCLDKDYIDSIIRENSLLSEKKAAEAIASMD